MADHSTRIAQIQSILESGVSEGTVDGVKVKFDLGSLRKELRRLKKEDPSQRSRPIFGNVNLSGF